MEEDHESSSSPLRCLTKQPAEFFHLLFYLDQPSGFGEAISRSCCNLFAGFFSGVAGGLAVTSALEKRKFLIKWLSFSCVFFGAQAFGLLTSLVQLFLGGKISLSCLLKTIKREQGDKVWDGEKEKWTSIHLSAAFAELPITDTDLEEEARNYLLEAMGEETVEKSNRNESSEEGECLESSTCNAALSSSTSFYHILGVQQTATAEEIQKAYHAAALKKHPDRIGCTPSSVEEFQRVHEAYTILSDPVSREEYNRLVTSTSSGSGSLLQAEGGAFPSNLDALRVAIFDSSHLSFAEPLIGHLPVFFFVTDHRFYSHQLRKIAQHRREVRLAHRLCQFLEEDSRFQSQFLEVVSDVASIVCGKMILRWIEEEYSSASEQFLSFWAWENMSTPISSLQGGLRLARSCVKLWKSKASRTGLIEGNANILTSVLLSFSEANIRQSVHQAALMVLNDCDVTKEERKRRALRLKELSSLIHEHCSRSDSTT